MIQKITILSFVFVALLSTGLRANIDVEFVESAPKDWFAFTNNSACYFENIKVTIDLSGSAGQLIFDTTQTGAGVQVFQPFEVREGDIKLLSSTNVQDGDTSLSINIADMKPGSQVSFTIDVDDTMPKSERGQTMISSSEMAQAKVAIEIDGLPITEALFDASSRAVVRLSNC